MPQGLQLWDAAGNLIVDYTTRCGLVLGRVDVGTGNQSGSVSNGGLADGAPFYFCIAEGDMGQKQPNVSFSGTTMSWSAAGFGTYTGSIFYGVR